MKKIILHVVAVIILISISVLLTIYLPKYINNEPQGNFSISFSYPSEDIPPVRFCFTNTEDISKQYCYMQGGYGFEFMETEDQSDEYLKSYRYGEEKSIPIGTYYLDYVVYNIDSNRIIHPVEIYFYNECVSSVNGVENIEYNIEYNGECEKYVEAVKSGSYSNYNSIYQGGKPIVFTIKKGETTVIGDILLGFDMTNTLGLED